MRNIESINLTAQRIVAVLHEMESITAKEKPSKADEMRHASLLAEFAMLKSGVTPQELAEARMAVIRHETGLRDVEVTIPRNVVEEWRGFLKGEKNELRTTDLQSTSQYGNVTGQTYSGNSGVLVPASFADRHLQLLGQFDEVLLPEACSIWNSETGSAGSVPFFTDYSLQGSPATMQFNKAVKLGEAIQSDVVPVKADALKFGQTPTWRSGRLAISLALEGDSDVFAGTVQLAERVFAQRTALAVGYDAITNILGAIGSAQNVTTAVNSTLDHFDCAAMYSALPNVYRKNAVIICNDQVRSLITNSLEANARPMIGSVEEILRKKIFVCPSMPTFSAGQSAIAIMYDPTFLIKRQVKTGTYVRRYREAVGGIEYGLSTVEAFTRCEVQPVGFSDAYFPPCAVLNAKS